jgi:hypothetical protein
VNTRTTATGVLLCVFLACSAGEELSTAPPPDDGTIAPIQVVLFTHIEDNTPAGLPGSQVHRTNYLTLRARLLDVAALMRRYSVRWSLEPDWSFLLAALQYEDAALRASTAGLNVLRYVRDSLGTAIDPHSHEGGGYNYTDVAHLLDSLGVGGSTVIGGHIWDPALPQFQEWDRFRVAVAGRRYPHATWRGSILMGSGTPNHVNDPIISGIWRPMSRTNYFDDDPAGNITCVGAFKGDIPGISELVTLYRTRQVATNCLLTSTMHVRPADILAPDGLTTIENATIKTLTALRDSGYVKLTDFTALIATWNGEYGGRACTHRVR